MFHKQRKFSIVVEQFSLFFQIKQKILFYHKKIELKKNHTIDRGSQAGYILCEHRIRSTPALTVIGSATED